MVDEIASRVAQTLHTHHRGYGFRAPSLPWAPEWRKQVLGSPHQPGRSGAPSAIRFSPPRSKSCPILV